HMDGRTSPYPESRGDYLDGLRAALSRAPRPLPEVPGLPFSGGLVGVSGFDVVRLFEKLPRSRQARSSAPDAAFTATGSALVFEHLPRRVALLHDGPENERQSLRREVMKLLRGPIPANGDVVSISKPA